jgi:5-formyltetrahydrofolate cyclo-ligase
MNKAALRNEILDQRKKLSVEEQRNLSRMIDVHLKGWNRLAQASRFAFYSPIHGEVDPGPMAARCLLRGAQVAYPRVGIVHAFPTIDLLWITDTSELTPGFHNIPEPQGTAIVAPDQIEVFLVPAVAFDRSGHRLGYGGGSYDHLLKQRNKDALVVGLGYDFQVQQILPHDPHDIPMDAIVTETGVWPLS